jgi:glycosyltransferase involved in cell wall biosynthesis
MRICSTLIAYPNVNIPHQGVFVRERLKRLADIDEVEVISPVLTFPGLKHIRHDAATSLPEIEQQDKIRVHHPKMYYLPGVAKFADGYLYYLALRKTFARLHSDKKFDIIDGHFAYPEGVGAALLARKMDLPFSITLRGLIEHRILRKRLRIPQVRWALKRAGLIIAVSGKLAKLAVRLGANRSKVHVVPNGVDANLFFPLDREQVRKKLELDVEGPVIVSVGNLIEVKGFHRIIEIMPELLRRCPGIRLVIVGGAMHAENYERKLRQMISQMNLETCVQITGSQPHEKINLWLNSANVFVLASSHEGWCNAIMESLAAGIPVVATDVGGNREIVDSPELGFIVKLGDREELLRAIKNALTKDWDREQIVSHARQYTWETAAEKIHNLFSQVCLSSE